jgi:hypothetical protein
VVAQVRQALPGIARALALVALLALLALALVAALVFWQGERDEVRRADAIVLLSASVQPDEAALDYALTLYRERQAPLLVLAADEESDLYMLVQQSGFPTEDLLLAEVAAAAGEPAQLRAVAVLAAREGIQTVLLVSHPDQLLLCLKIAGDQELTAYGAPLPNQARTFPGIMQASLNYWRFVLLGG